jgi:hypothetical protein
VATISITAADAGTVIASGDGTLTALALIDAGQPEPWSLLALTDGNGYALYLSDALGIIPVDNAIWGKPLLSFAVPYVGGLVAKSLPPTSSRRHELFAVIRHCPRRRRHRYLVCRALLEQLDQETARLCEVVLWHTDLTLTPYALSSS